MKNLKKYSIFKAKLYLNWEQITDKRTLNRHKWLSQIWADLYIKNPNDDFIRKLSTDELMKTNWFEHYGIKEPNFHD